MGTGVAFICKTKDLRNNSIYSMKLEHFALNVAEAVAVARWYERYLGLKVVAAQSELPYGHFLADDSGRIMIEIYQNSAADIPDYMAIDPLTLHLAFVSDAPEDDTQRLVAAGATLVSETRGDGGTHLVMLRDPWGLAVQLCKRGTPLLTDKELPGDAL